MSTISIQAVGQVAAIKAEDLKVGMVRMYNFGITHEIVSIAPKGKQSLTLTTRSANGEIHTAAVRRNSMVAAG